MIHKNQIGVAITLTSSKDISSASSYKIRYIKPSKTTGEWTAEIDGDTNIKYTTESGDLDEAGIWTFQGYAVYPGGSDDYTDRVNGKVYSPIEV